MTWLCTVFAVALLADPKAEALKRLDDAKADYKEVETFHRKAIENAFTALEDAARNDGSKKAVDAVKLSRDAFKLWGEYPASVPRAAMADARGRLSKGYEDAIKDLIKAKADREAEQVEKEKQAWLVESALLAGKRTWLNSIRPFNVRVEQNWFTTNGTQHGSKLPLAFKGHAVPHSIFLHASKQGTSQASFNLAGKYHTFRASVGVPKIEAATENPHSTLTFEVFADGRSIWKSKDVEKIEDHQDCEVNVERVKVLTLQVHCGGSNFWGRSVWFEPMLTEP